MRRVRTALAATLFAGLSAACAGAPAAEPVSNAKADAFSTSPAPAETFTGWSVAELATLEAALAATHEIVASSFFETPLLAQKDVHESPRGAAISGSELLRLFAARRPVEYVRVPDSPNETAGTCIHAEGAVTNLGAGNLDRWPSGSSHAEFLRRACLVNTLAHEWMHQVAGSGACGERFIDDGHRSSSVALVPYTVGAIAQCAYLEKHGVIEHAKLASCVAAVGTKVFNGLTVCESDVWLGRLTNDAGE